MNKRIIWSVIRESQLCGEHMKRFALLRLQHNANKVIFDINAPDLAAAIETANKSLTNVQLDKDGYGRIEGSNEFDHVTYCIAEYFSSYTI